MASFSEILSQDKPVLIDFFAEWCGPCKAMSPILKEVKDELGEAAIILKVDVDKNQALAVKYNVRGVPTLILFQKKQIVWQQSGVVTKNDIVAKIKEHFE